MTYFPMSISLHQCRFDSRKATSTSPSRKDAGRTAGEVRTLSVYCLARAFTARSFAHALAFPMASNGDLLPSRMHDYRASVCHITYGRVSIRRKEVLCPARAAGCVPGDESLACGPYEGYESIVQHLFSLSRANITIPVTTYNRTYYFS